MVDNGLPRSLTKCFVSNVESMLSWQERVWQPSGTFSVFVPTTSLLVLSCAVLSSTLRLLLSSDERAWITLVSTTSLSVLSEETVSSWKEFSSISWERDVFLPSCTVLVSALATGCPDLSRLGLEIGWFDWKLLESCPTCPSGCWACSEPNSFIQSCFKRSLEEVEVTWKLFRKWLLHFPS